MPPANTTAVYLFVETGIGMAITANKVKGCYAAVCHDIYSTQRSILSNNCNVMCMGALVIGPATAETLGQGMAVIVL